MINIPNGVSIECAVDQLRRQLTARSMLHNPQKKTKKKKTTKNKSQLHKICAQKALHPIQMWARTHRHADTHRHTHARTRMLKYSPVLGQNSSSSSSTRPQTAAPTAPSSPSTFCAVDTFQNGILAFFGWRRGRAFPFLESFEQQPTATNERMLRALPWVVLVRCRARVPLPSLLVRRVQSQRSQGSPFSLARRSLHESSSTLFSQDASASSNVTSAQSQRTEGGAGTEPTVGLPASTQLPSEVEARLKDVLAGTSTKELAEAVKLASTADELFLIVDAIVHHQVCLVFALCAIGCLQNRLWHAVACRNCQFLVLLC